MTGGGLVPNPIGLLRDLAKEAVDIHELLILTYNHDLGFFERTILGAARATGGRVTVLGDVAATDHDPAAIKRAGISYLPGLARARGAFHPKVIIATGPQRSLVAVGSGNLTMAGWWGNDELWTVHHGRDRTGSPVLPQTAQWCRALPEHVSVDPSVTEALARAADLLDRYEVGDEECYAVHTLDRPIIEQLPHGPVDALHLYAPFYDLKGDAVSALCERMQPASVVVAFQPDLTSADGPRLLERLPARATFRALESNRYRHGKLIEWSVDGQWTALTGSPNLSRAALLSTAGAGGNVEFGIVAPTPAPLLPEGMTSAVEAVSALRPGRRGATRSNLLHLILAATVEDGRVRLLLARPCPENVRLQGSRPDDLPDQWQDLGPLPAGLLSVVVTADLPGGSRLRILVDGRPSTFVPLSDPDLVLHRSSSGRPRVRQAPGFDRIFSDPAALEELFRLHDQLVVSTFEQSASPGAIKASAMSPKDHANHSVGDWRDYLEVVAPVIGQGTLAWLFGTGLSTSSKRPTTGVDIDWDDPDLDDTVAALDHDDVDEIADQVDAQESEWHIAEQHRERYRKAASTTPGPEEQLAQAYLRLRALLQLVAAGAWPVSDDSWLDPLLTRLEHLPVAYERAEQPVKDNLGPLVASAAAIAVSISARAVEGLRVTRRQRRHRTARGKIAHLLIDADPEMIRDQSKTLTGRFGSAVDVGAVMSEVSSAVENDAFADAIERIETEGWETDVDNRVVVIPDSVPDPAYLALVLISQFDGAAPVAIATHGPQGKVSIAAASTSHLVILRSGARPGTHWGSTYALSTFLKLRDLVDGNLSTLPRPKEELALGQAPGPLASAVLESAGLLDADGHLRMPSGGVDGK